MTSKGSKAFGGLAPQYQGYTRQKCFIAFSKNAPWARDLLNGCRLTLELPEFNLEADYASKHLKTDTPLHEKALELILNSRFGVYDLSWWQDKNGQWQMPRNVYIELGMAIAGNRPTLLVRHANDRGRKLPEILEAFSASVLEFGGVSTLKHALGERLRKWIHIAPDQEWWNRYCILGNRICDYREVHPRTKHWGKQELWCYISDGFDPDREDFRTVVEDALRKINELSFGYLDAINFTQGYPFLLCSRCQAARSYSFGIYRITPYSSPETFIVLGMSIALQAQFGYRIPKLLIANDAKDIPSLLAGYDVVVAPSDSERAEMLSDFIPEVVRNIRKTVWKSRPLPFLNVKPNGVEDYSLREIDRAPDRSVVFGIPESVSVFIGREDELALVLKGLQSGKTVIIRGQGGVGKTSLAVESVRRANDNGMFPDGILWGSLYSSKELELEKSWVRALGGETDDPNDVRTLSKDLKRLMQGKRILTVLDGAESANEIKLLVPQKDHALLITTRVWPLQKIGGDVVVQLGGLPRTSSVELLRRTLEDGGISTMLTDKQADELASAASDSPLALKLVAGLLLRGISVDLALEQLRSGSLTERSLNISLELTYNKLTKDEQRVLRTIGVLRVESFDANVLATLTELDDLQIQDIVKVLILGGLVQIANDLNRFSIHPIVKEFAKDKLRSAGEWDFVSQRYDEYVRGSLESDVVHLLPELEIALKILVEKAVETAEGSVVKKRIHFERYSKNPTLNTLLNLISSESKTFEPYFRRREDYYLLVQEGETILQIRNEIAHSRRTIDLSAIQRIRGLLENLIQLVRETTRGLPINVTDDSFEKIVLRTGLPVVVFLWAAWSGYSRMLAPFLEKMARDYSGQALIAKLDSDSNSMTVTKYDVVGIPSLIYFKNGKELDRLVFDDPGHRRIKEYSLPRNVEEIMRQKLDSILIA